MDCKTTLHLQSQKGTLQQFNLNNNQTILYKLL